MNNDEQLRFVDNPEYPARGYNPTRIKMDITHTDTNTREETTAILREWQLLRSHGVRPEWCYAALAVFCFSFAAYATTAASNGSPVAMRLLATFGALCLVFAVWLPFCRNKMIRRILDALENGGAFAEPTTVRLTDETMEIVQGDSIRGKKPWRAFGNEFAFVPHGLLILTDGIFSAEIGNELVEVAGREELTAVLERAGLRPRKAGLGRAEIVRGVLAALLGILLARFLLRN